MESNSVKERISIQVALSGFSFSVYKDGELHSESGWQGPDRVFTMPEFQRRYDEVQISLFTPKVTLVPATCFSQDTARAALEEVVNLDEEDVVNWAYVPLADAWLVYSNSIGELLSKTVSSSLLTIGGEHASVLPEMWWILDSLEKCRDYNKILASWRDGWLHLAVAQGRTLLFANVFKAQDFTTAEYWIFSVLKRLQINPEVSTMSFRTPITEEEEMSLCRYFAAAEQIAL